MPLCARPHLRSDGSRGRGGRRPYHLASCYRRSIEVAAAAGVRTLAFPAISTGVYGYPLEAAAVIAVATTRAAAAQHPVIEEIVFCCFSAGDLEVYRRLLA